VERVKKLGREGMDLQHVPGVHVCVLSIAGHSESVLYMEKRHMVAQPHSVLT
jgi:hypothetical protein